MANGQGDDWRPETYTVRPGDTLYAIALDHGQDYRDISAWSELADPNLIHVGQILRVKAPPGWSERAVVEPEVIARPMQPAAAIQATPLEAVPPPPLLKTPKAVKQPYSEQALAQLRGLPYKPPPAASPPATAGAPRTSPGTSAASASLPLPPRPPSAAGTAPATAPPASAPATPPQGTVIAGSTATRPAPDTAAPPQAAWAWPARGRLLHGFNAGPNPKGIVISGELGQPVWASAAGKVVYSGSGLRGYGKLIIVKHDKTYLSVYAHNRELLVKEGEQVVKGQKIAEMGNSESNRVALHFEIRRLGKPVDPLQYLTPL